MNKNVRISNITELYDKSAVGHTLGYLIDNPADLKKYSLKEDDFIDPIHKIVFLTLQEMVNYGYKEIDEADMEEYIKANNEVRYVSFSKHNGIGYVHNCKQFDRNFLPHYYKVKKWSIMRDAYRQGEDLSEILWDSDSVDDEDQAKKDRFNQMTPQELIECLEQLHKKRISSIKEKNPNCYNSVFAIYKGNNLPYSEPKEPLIDGFMLQNTMNSVIAPAKAGKSFFSYQMAHAVQNGYEFLGRKTHKTDVLYIDFELRNDAISTRCANVNKNYGGEGEYFNVIPLASTWGTDTVSLDRLVEVIKEAKKENPNLGLVIFDCYYRFAEGEENSADDVKATLGKLKTLTGNMTVVYVHHTNKRPTDIDIDKLDSGTVLIQASGSVVHSRAVDQTYYIYNTADGNYVFNTGRDWYDDVLVCTRNELGYFELEDAETQAQSKGERNELASKPTGVFKSKLDKLREEYPEIVEYIEEYGDEYGVGRKALIGYCKKELGKEFEVSDLKEIGLIYTGKDKRVLPEDTPTDKFMLPK